MPVVDDITQMIGCLRDGNLNLKEAQAAGQLQEGDLPSRLVGGEERHGQVR